MNKKITRVTIIALIIIIASGAIIYRRHSIRINYPQAQQGMMLINNYSPGDLVPLNGEWEFYWQQLLGPGDFNGTSSILPSFVPFPGLWKDYQIDGQRLESRGFATYRLELKIPPLKNKAALKIPWAYSAYKLWWNGQLIAANGLVASEDQDAALQRRNIIIPLPELRSENEIIVQVSNFDLYRGGIISPIYFGDYNTIVDHHKFAVFRDALAPGILFAFGPLYFWMYLKRRPEKASLYFSLVCMIFAVRSLVVNEIILTYLFPAFNWYIGNRLESGSVMVGLPVLFIFSSRLYPEEINPLVSKFWKSALPVILLVILFTPALVYDNFMQLLLFPFLLSAVYIFYATGKAMAANKDGAEITMISYIFLLVTGLDDLLVFYSQLENINLLHYGMCIFIITQGFLLISRLTDSFQKVEQLALENQKMYLAIKELNEDLEKKVAERTRSLYAANETLKYLSNIDSLTGIPNRRYMDEIIELEWRRAKRNSSYLSVAMIDIDFFKQFNDTYGHVAGDECLRKIAAAILSCVGRGGDFVARYGGEEFIVILPATDQKGAEVIGKKIRKAVEKLSILHCKSPISQYVTVSIGMLTVFMDKEITIRNILEIVDKALYNAKGKGRNCVESIRL